MLAGAGACHHVRREIVFVSRDKTRYNARFLADGLDMRFARRTDWDLRPNKISGILEDFKKRGQAFLDLTESNPTKCGFVDPGQRILATFANQQNMFYAPASQGLLEAREALAAYYCGQGIKLSPRQIFLTASSSEAYSFIFRLLADPQDVVLFPQPSYPLFDFLADLNDVKTGGYPLFYDGQWAIDLCGLENNITSRTKAVVVVNPNNPTGNYVNQKQLKSLGQICQKASLALISDEVFFDYAFDRKQSFISLASHQENLTFTLGGLSKMLGLPQMKLSWIVLTGPQAIVEDAIARLEMIADTYLSVNTPSQNALAGWLSLRLAIQEQIRSRTDVNRAFLLKSFASETLGGVLQTQGGWYMIIKLPNGFDEESLVEDLLLKDQVYVHPGYFFNFSDEPYLILSLLPPEEIFSQGVNRILSRLKNSAL